MTAQISSSLYSDKKNRIKGQHLRADSNHERNALHRMFHFVRPAIIVFLVAPWGERAYALDTLAQQTQRAPSQLQQMQQSLLPNGHAPIPAIFSPLIDPPDHSKRQILLALTANDS